MNPATNIQYLKGVGEKRAQLFRRLGVDSLMTLLRFYPRAYEDWSRIYSVSDAPEGVNCCVGGLVACAPETRRISGGRTIVRTAIVDGANSVNLVYFNNPYVAPKLKEGDEYLFFGKLEKDPYNGCLQMISPQFVPKNAAGKEMHPIYRQTGTLNSKTIAKCVRTALDSVREDLQETLPDSLIRQYRLLPLWEALEKIHFPKNEQEINEARRRLAFEELLSLELGLLSLKPKEKNGAVIADRSGEFVSLLPFRLTNAQRRAIGECMGDMQEGYVMRRLLQGDVGSGKTAVAAGVVYSCVRAGYQAAMMAPTEVLAGQHFRTFLNFFENTGIRTAVLSGSMSKKSKEEVKARLLSGEIDFVVGTHALIQDDVEFRNLGLVITDEQHRFGVHQRSALAEKGSHTHMLVMSATPIPRTLGMIIYGDMSVSVLDELPRGRKPVKTYLVDESYRPRLYRFLEKAFEQGRQGYVVCPLVGEGSDDTSLIPAQEYYAYLKNEVFSGRKLGLLHGKMKPAEKEKVMTDFAEGRIQLLVATTVVEVGVDVPNAAVMVIENADRFGLSQLHQLRGRVGRGDFQSYCILVSGNQNPETEERLRIICTTSDGFKIADEDLRLRGPGDFFGQRQHGLPMLKIADIVTDTRILTAARDIAERILQQDPRLEKEENQPLWRAVQELFSADALA